MASPKINKVHLIYFPIRGLAEKMRLLLEAAKIPYEDTRITPSEWPALKQTGDFLFGQMPKVNVQFEDGSNIDLFQSNTIFRFLAKKAGLLGNNEIEQAKVEMMIDAGEDIRSRAVKLFYSPDFDNLKEEYITQTIPAMFEIIEKVLAQNGTDFLVGNSLTAADINLFDLVENHKLLAGEGFLDKFPLTKKNNEVVGATFSSYIASGRRPEALNGPSARFMGCKV